jgi:hypothetical protein
MATAKEVRTISTIHGLRQAFESGEIDSDEWVVCVDGGRLYLRWLGDEENEKVPDPPVTLDFAGQSPWASLAAALNEADVPAEQA